MGKCEKLIKQIKEYLIQNGIQDTDSMENYGNLIAKCIELNEAIYTRNSEEIKMIIGDLTIKLLAYMESVKNVSVKEWSYCPNLSREIRNRPKKSLLCDQGYMQQIVKSIKLDNLNYMDVDEFSIALKNIAVNHGYSSYDCMKAAFEVVEMPEEIIHLIEQAEEI
ncbi:hypothetical protein MMJ61_09285 [Enterococcus cecorum]|uniref:Uncharacterized protein n=2 Tax=Enterococcus cecorum TaxID=44008 RepID=A0AAW9JKJ2_9ENTE|nr:hypothetical protein [Enterococcus cecorum]MCJ0572354.1 hypothetical protein [Enterococcus cecorum]MCJ0577222.1 hypothetical protein [Enterococcus cecorum]MCJ0584249.1 hypothetical protein [Enterococcus cecorum]MCJ0589568.1 hypothetical protein [Enterococcus cecorum]MDZ5504176.1 hypothetical protein [Enterococcus cecorum]